MKIIHNKNHIGAILALLLLVVYTMQCSQVPTHAGGGSDTEVVGSIVTRYNTPAANTQVACIPRGYNPVLDPTYSQVKYDTTDAQGRYHFMLSDKGMYTIQAVHVTRRTRLLVTGIAIDEDRVVIPQERLKLTGAVTVILPDTTDTANGFVFINGTTMYQSLSRVTLLNEGGYAVTLDSVPEATIPAISYDNTDDMADPSLITDTVTVLSNDTSVVAAHIFWANYTRDNSPLLQNQVYDIYKAPDGTLWFGTSYGCVLFDGTEWTILDTYNSGLPDNTIMEIVPGMANKIWFATMSGGAAVFDGTTWETYSVSNSGLPSDFVTHIIEESDGTIWISMYGGIARFDGMTWTTYDTTNCNLPSNDVTFITMDTEGSLWFSTYEGVGKFDGTTWTIYNTFNSPMPISQACRVMVDSRGNKWFGHWNGMVTMFDGSNWVVYDSTHSQMFLTGHIYDLVEDADGSIWIGTTLGLTKFDGNRWTDYAGEQYALLENNTMYSIIIDSDKNTWVGTGANGLVAFGPTIK